MSERIKELLIHLTDYDSHIWLDENECKELVDYITNLQEENENLKYDIKGYEQERTNFYKSIHTSIVQKKQLTNKLNKLTNKYNDLQQENERLKNGYCELKVKCNNGECDCTNEEYEDMAQANMRGSLLLEDYKSRNEKAIEYINNNSYFEDNIVKTMIFKDYSSNLLNILQGVGKDE